MNELDVLFEAPHTVVRAGAFTKDHGEAGRLPRLSWVRDDIRAYMARLQPLGSGWAEVMTVAGIAYTESVAGGMHMITLTKDALAGKLY